MKIKTKSELEALSMDELRAYKKEISEHKERAELLGEIEVQSDPIRDLKAIKDEAQKGNSSPELVAELSVLKGKIEQLQKKDAPTFDGKFNKQISKELGAKGEEAVAMAKDLAAAIPQLDAVSGMTGQHITELKAYKTFIGADRPQFELAMKAILKQNQLSWARKTALDTSDSSEWVPTGFEASVMDAILKAKGVAANLPSFQMPNSPFDWPVNGANGSTYYVTQSLTGGNITVAGSNISAAKTTFSAIKIATRQDYSEEMSEDAAFALLPAVQRMMIDSLGDGFERVCLFGDTQATTSNINYNGGSVTTTAGAADVFLATKGLVYKALVDSNGSKVNVSAAASPSEAVRLTMAAMNEGAKDLVLFVPPAFYFALLDDPAVKTLDKYGSSASILSGEVARVYGIPVIMTSGIPLTGTDGKVDGVTAGNNTLASFCLVNKSRVMIGLKRNVKVAADYFNITDHHSVVASMRFDIQQFGANVALKNPIGYGYNYAV